MNHNLICPRCKLPLSDHDGGCPKRLSRRFFLGAFGSAFGAAALAKVLPNVEITHPEPGDTLVLAEPKVHEASYIVIDRVPAPSYDLAGFDGETAVLSKASMETPEEFITSCEKISARHRRAVIGKYNGKVLRVIHHEEALRLAGGNLG